MQSNLRNQYLQDRRFRGFDIIIPGNSNPTQVRTRVEYNIDAFSCCFVLINKGIGFREELQVPGTTIVLHGPLSI